MYTYISYLILPVKSYILHQLCNTQRISVYHQLLPVVDLFVQSRTSEKTNKNDCLGRVSKVLKMGTP